MKLIPYLPPLFISTTHLFLIMKALFYSLFLILLTLGCNNANQSTTETPAVTKVKNEVLVLGMIHGRHLTEESYGIDVLRSLIQKIDPDLILTEIPPDRFPIAMKEFQETDSISEPRVKRFPEYIDVIFPLSKTMKFQMIPTAGWTKPMADARSKKLKEISEDPTRKADWEQFTQANAKSDSLMEATGKRYDPYWINTDAYDELAEIQLGTYNRLFNEELGLGGWDNINEAHFSHIAKALDDHQYEGKRVLITYGAGHKGWFLRALKKRTDIKIVELADIVPSDK